MSNINTISEFLVHAGTDYRVFDMARGIRVVDSQTFLEIENGEIAAPYPRQQHAWFGILFFNKQLSTEHYIWFVKLPLDEQGKIISAGRKQFLQIVTEALGAQLDKTDNPNNQLPENPFTFVPNQNQLADFNAKSRCLLNIEPSHQFTHIKQHINAPHSQNWQTLTLQEIADFCAQIQRPAHSQLLVEHFETLAPELQKALCTSLENNTPPKALIDTLLAWQTKAPTCLVRAELTLRGTSQSPQSSNIKACLINLLKSDLSKEPNVLILISARHWLYLNDADVLALYVQALAEQDGQLFAGLFPDLVQIPAIRNTMLSVLRWPEKSQALTKAIGHLFGQEQ